LKDLFKSIEVRPIRIDAISMGVFLARDRSVRDPYEEEAIESANSLLSTGSGLRRIPTLPVRGLLDHASRPMAGILIK
jgi:hypothetical protein